MSDQADSRALMLEQLESRCLLAGGIFSFSDAYEDHQDSNHTQRNDHERSRNDRGAQVRSHDYDAPGRTRQTFRDFERGSQRGQQSNHLAREVHPVVTPNALPLLVTPNQRTPTQNPRISQGEPLGTQLGSNNNQLADSLTTVLFVVIRQDDTDPEPDRGIIDAATIVPSQRPVPQTQLRSKQRSGITKLPLLDQWPHPRTPKFLHRLQPQLKSLRKPLRRMPNKQHVRPT